jgi:hypothetical protein
MNTNILEGWICPNCGNERKFEVEAQTWATLTDDGGEASDLDYDDDSAAKCYECDHAGTVKDFRRPLTQRRVLVAVTIPDWMGDADAATWLNALDGDLQDPVVWSWPLFWQDVEDGFVGPDGDQTMKDRGISADGVVQPTEPEGT